MAAPPIVHNLAIASSQRIFPESRLTASSASASRRTAALSITDNAASRSPPPSGLWLWDRPADARGRSALDLQQLTGSLRRTLNSFPFLAGQLAPTVYKPDGDHTQRYGCMQLTWGDDAGPGVELVTASCPASLASLVPSPAERARTGCFDASGLAANEFFPSTHLALWDEREYAGLPCTLLQLTTFACGGLALAVRHSHAICDTRSMLTFVRHWAAVNRAMLDGSAMPDSSPLFDPSLVDSAAAGDVDADTADPELVAVSRSLPQLRNDWWASAESVPPFFAGMAQIPPVIPAAAVQPLGPPIPWEADSFTSPVLHYMIDFTPDEVEAAWQETRSSGSSAAISHLDALLAHLSRELCLARGLQDDDQPNHLTVSLNIRDRLQQPLPPEFMGSAILFATATMTPREICSQPLAVTAAAIRSAVSAFTAKTIAAALHDMAHEVCPQRICRFLFGRHPIAASWLRLGIQDVEFGQAEAPRYFDGVLPFGAADGGSYIFETGRAGGLTFTLGLRADVMKALIASPTLRKYRQSQQQQQ